MKIALVQSNPAAGAVAANMAALERAVEKAAELGADLCVAPEMALCGHNAGDFLLREGFAEDCRTELHAAALRLGAQENLPPLLLGAPIINPVPQGKRLQNCAVLLDKGRVTVLSRKVLLPSEGIHDDTRYFEPGVACGVLHSKGWRLGITIGEDIWNDRTFWQTRRTYTVDPVADFIAAGGADGILNLTALPYEQGLPSLHQRMVAHTAVHYRVPVLSVNLAGGNDSLVYYGGSFAVDASGTVKAGAPMFEEALLLVDLVGEKGGILAPKPEPMEEIWRAVVLGTRDFARKCGFTSAVLGLSGGVDSALVAAIAVEALGAENVTGLLMPSPYSSEGSVADSLALAGNLGFAAHVLPVDEAMGAFEHTFAAAFPGGLAGSAEENIQARIRGCLLMAYSNRFGALLLETSNKSEAAVGYSTLYGDMAGGLGPIGDLYKHQVYSLCRWYNSGRAGGIPEAVLVKEPSAELRPEQKDSDFLPSYDVLDPLLYDIVEKGRSAPELVEKGYEQALVDKVLHMMRRAEFKRHQAPPCLHLSSRSFGRCWRFPIAMSPTGVQR